MPSRTKKQRRARVRAVAEAKRPRPPWEDLPQEEPFDPAELRAKVRRALVVWAKLHMICKREGCRRNARCARPDDTPCYGENLGALREHVFPALQAAREKRDKTAASRRGREELPAH